MKEFDKTDARNVLESLRRRAANRLDPGRDRPDGPLPTEHIGGELEGTFQFKLINQDGSVETVQTHNSLVDVGRNALLQYLADISDSVTDYTFSGDGATTQFTLPYPYKPITDVVDVSVGGASQTEHTDYSVDYQTGTIYFDAAPGSGTDNISVDVDYTTHPFRWLGVGTDGTAVADGQTGLLAESTRVDLDSGFYTRDEGAVEVTGRWTFAEGQANVSIAEAGLFAVPSSAPVGGDMLNRTVVSPTIDKSSSQSLQVDWTLSMS